MPKLREYVQDSSHTIPFSSSKHGVAVPSSGSAHFPGGQPVKLKLDAAHGQQTRQARSFLCTIIMLNNQSVASYLTCDHPLFLIANAGGAT
jgi:hypothetical protein